MQSDSILQKRELFAVSLRKKKTRMTIESKRLQARLAVESYMLQDALWRLREQEKISPRSYDRILKGKFEVSVVTKELSQTQQNLLLEILLKEVQRAALSDYQVTEAIHLLYKFLYVSDGNLRFFISQLEGIKKVAKALVRKARNLDLMFFFFFTIETEALVKKGIDPIVGLHLYQKFANGMLLRKLISFVLENKGYTFSEEWIEVVYNKLKITYVCPLNLQPTPGDEQHNTAFSLTRQALLRLGKACLPAWSVLDKSDLCIPYEVTIVGLTAEFIDFPKTEIDGTLEFLIQACELFRERAVQIEVDAWTWYLLGTGKKFSRNEPVNPNSCALFSTVGPYFYNSEKCLSFLTLFLVLKRNSNLQAELIKLYFLKGKANLLQTHWLAEPKAIDLLELMIEKWTFVLILLNETRILLIGQGCKVFADVTGCPDYSAFQHQIIRPCFVNVILPPMKFYLTQPSGISQVLRILKVLAEIVLQVSDQEFSEEFLALLDQFDLKGHIDKVLQSEQTARCNSGILSMEIDWRMLAEEVQEFYSLLEKLAERANEEAAVLEQARSGRMLI